jgi:1,4-alpha-glucan branching enzyme
MAKMAPAELLAELDLHLFGEGRHHRLWEILGAHLHQDGVSFAVWAPNARSVSVVGDWNGWDPEKDRLRPQASSGVWACVAAAAAAGHRYKFAVEGADGRRVLKSDPFAFATEAPPATASVVSAPSNYSWADGDWMELRSKREVIREPMAVYELHLGSWRRGLSYRDLAEQLPGYVRRLGFTHVELMPVSEHPFSGSWGYQVTGYFAPTARFGEPNGLRALVDALHQEGIGVIVDWVPAHFPADENGLARFDGTALYEHEDPRKGKHPDWGTLVFNYGRNEVRNFLIANALYWIEEFHFDALRVDAVASMLYLDYSRGEGEWVPNAYGGRENLEAVGFVKDLNEVVFGTHPGVTVIAEESTAWPGVSRPTYLGGLGFGFKWNMGWMHDTLSYFAHDPVHRRWHQGELTFGLLYAWSENYVLPLSHDEVVHGKGSLLAKMPGDRWQQLANLRALYGWMWAHPGKKLLFMGGELASEREWDHDGELDWWILESWEDHRRLWSMVAELNRIYRERPALWEEDFRPEGFEWIDSSDAAHSVLSFLRKDATGRDVVVCVANLTPVVRHAYRVGLPAGGRWTQLLNTDDARWGGSGATNAPVVEVEAIPWHGRDWSAALTLPPLGALWLAPA